MENILNRTKGYLVLEDGTKFNGYSFGSERSVAGECVFSTGMVGYNESISDPSYTGQILVFSYPLIGNYGVPSFNERDPNSNLPINFESEKAHTQAIICSDYCDEYSHWAAEKSLSEWLKESNIPGLYGIDTRALITKIREKGSLKGKVIIGDFDESKLEFEDINLRNLVAEVSTKTIKTYKAPENSKRKNKKVIVLDCGIKNNQIRCLLNRGVDLKVVPWDYDVVANEPINEYDGVFISNGPGDPSVCGKAIENIRKLFALEKSKALFGVCMGNQLLGLAAGAKTHKMAFGNRGLNQPCVDQISGRCHITSQNHGFVIDTGSLPAGSGWKTYFINANDASNEGIYHESKPWFSVQFHPEAMAGPTDTEYLFDNFVNYVCGEPFTSPMNKSKVIETPKNINKVLILGSGGLSIGQAGEFDYSGSQAIKALKEEGIKTIVINPNIATVQTSPGLADKVYFLPVNAASVQKVIENENPDGILVTFGGQTALNCGIELYKSGILEKHNCKVLGTQIETIIATEDRGIFAEKLAEINERIAPSMACNSLEESIVEAEKIGYPVIVRAAYCLGGLGSGFADNKDQLIALVTEALATSSQVLVEKSLKGWKEIEYEVLRDSKDNCITVCNMENFDPLGIHTGESIVVAPSQTLTDKEYQMLRETAIKTVRHLGVVGECNIQYALNPHSQEYCIIEVNARLSRSSALASKATGYPLAFISAKVALGFDLAELRNTITKKTTACFEPSLDYLVVKMPRWDLKKFTRVSNKISSSMKSVGEVMSIGRKFEEAIQKAIRMVMDNTVDGFQAGVFPTSDEELENPTNNRILVLASAFKDGYSVEKVHQLTKIDRWFLTKLKSIIDLENHLSTYSTPSAIPNEILKFSKQQGFSDKQIAKAIGATELSVRDHRKKSGIIPITKHIDTVAAEFPAQNNYLYMTYNGETNDIDIKDKSYITLGSGSYRIGSSVEFDWCGVSCIRTLRSLGLKSIMINFNPETVSTDYDECDYLYFEELSLERVLDIYERGGPNSTHGVILSVGGQIPNNLAIPLSRCGVNVLGTHPDMIDSAENRYKFSRLLDTVGIDQPLWKELTSVDDTKVFCETVGFPCLVRPSYVLSGAAMNVVHSSQDLETFLSEAAAVSRDYPVVISKFIQEAKEIEIDAVADNGQIVLFAISEHVENAGVHSGDATLVCPAQDLDDNTILKVEETARKIAAALNVSGPFNIQFIAKNNEIKVIECNLRCSRSFPFVSKTLNVNFIELATKIIISHPYDLPQVQSVDYVGVKVPQFSFIRLKGADPVLGVEMASTGEVACFGNTREEAYIKGLISTGFRVPEQNVLLSIGSFKEKEEFLPSAKKLVSLGFTLFGTQGTADYYSEQGLPVTQLNWDEEELGENVIQKRMTESTIHLFINLPSKNKYRRPSSFMSRGYNLRRAAIDFQVPLITNIKCAKLFVDSIPYMKGPMPLDTVDCRSSNKIVRLPGLVDVHVHLREPGATHKEDWDSGTATALAGGFTMVGAMPNTSPAIMDQATFELAKQLSSSKARCDFGIFIGATFTNTTTAGNFANEAMGMKMYLEETFAPLPLKDDINVWRDHIMNWPDNTTPICVHADGRNLAAILLLGWMYNKQMHVCHVSHKEEIDIIRDAKKRGMRLSCEVSPHHLTLCDKDIPRIGAGQSEVRPKLGTEEDMKALWDNIDYIDMIATDHAPHTYEEKCSAKPPPGFPGLETSLPLMLTAVHQGKITLEELVKKMHTNPIQIFNLPEQPDTYIEVDMDQEWVIPKKPLYSRCGWTPFEGLKVKGKVVKVVLRGQTAFIDGKILVEKGYGMNLRSKEYLAEVERLKEQKTKTQLSFVGEKSVTPSVQSPTIISSPKKPSKPVESHLPLVGGPNIVGKREDILQSLFNASDNSFVGKHVFSVKQFTRKQLHTLFAIAHEMRILVKRSGGSDLLKGKVMATLFYEPSTRTCCSFTAAMERLGGRVVNVDNVSSSVAKGESISDTIHTLESYCDAIVMRHPAVGSVESAISVAKKPIINAGDGVGEHPTQALLDIFTIREELGTVNGLTITLVGDLKNGRTVHSLVKLLSLYQVKINYVAPESLSMPQEIIKELNEKGIEQKQFTSLDSILSTTNVLYVTRIQKERFSDLQEYENVKDSFVITPQTLTKALDNMIVMHPLPRINEISQEVDSDPRAAYFRQMENGMYVRMALLALLFGKN
ncbi:aspartate carbamoyltransferase [Dictyostelium purpureum]|uniref:Aspartate carbamoyltransferase n=1 Tax=Dictyostelium purpureum TaxID=5786 RepID=F0ZGH3_DICPU|nr:aspartate carbamoyltransferase [Dictyostelium purpureum]EGC36956.1 aspartate carbamoyltransferase [Dictyostelium purpureum]|eukprot:XP_003286524.1 aspartate carbamoyltransferase [Dictyostelium purpureum]